MTTTSDFSKVIECYLLDKAQKEPEFKTKFEAKDKNISDCITYILNVVKSTGCQGFTDEEVYQMAINYYTIKDVEVGKRFDAKAVVNHSIDTPQYIRYKITADEMKWLSNQIKETTNQEVLKCLEADLQELREEPFKYWQGLPLESYKNDNEERFNNVTTMLTYYKEEAEKKKKAEEDRKKAKEKAKKQASTRRKKAQSNKTTKPKVETKPKAETKPKVVKTESKFKTPPPLQVKIDKHGQSSLF